MKCGYAGCKNEATLKLTQKAGKNQTLYACEHCAPAWVKQVKAGTVRSNFYEVAVLK